MRPPESHRISRLARYVGLPDGLSPEEAVANADRRLEEGRAQVETALSAALETLSARSQGGHEDMRAAADEVACLAAHLGRSGLARVARSLCDLLLGMQANGRWHAAAYAAHLQAIGVLQVGAQQDQTLVAELLAGLKIISARALAAS